jgi:hypothetical protein
MALTLKILGIGQLSTTEAVIATASKTKGALVQNISLANTNTSTPITVNGIWVKVADSANPGTFLKKLISPQNFTIAPNAQIVFENDITLGQTENSSVFTGNLIPDSLVAKLTSGSGVDFVVCGMERDV